jgi:ABC-type glycerol-3-phosphate transport system substrate-binding protein
MKKHILFLAISALSIGLSSCGGDKKTVEDSSQQEKNCFYSYNSGSTVLEWTAFKFTEKTGVNGTFNKITIEGMEKSDDPKHFLLKQPQLKHKMKKEMVK